MKKNQIYEGTIESIKFPNKGIMNVEGHEVMVKNTLIGQEVKVRISKKRKSKIEGKVVELVKRADNEVEAPCSYAEKCGGCSYQTLNYEDQLELKVNQVKTLLSKFDIESKFEGIEKSPKQFGYRNKMEFSFGDECKGGDLALGMHKRGAFYDIVNIEDCKIVDEDFNQILKVVSDYFRALGLPYYKKNHEGYLRHLVVRRAEQTGEILINLVTSSQLSPDLAQLVDKLKELQLNGHIVGILHTINDSLADVVQSDETRILFGQDFFMEGLLGLKFKISAFSFFQTNSLGAEVLYSVVRDFAGDLDDKLVFDLYCGTGTIAQIMAPKANKVMGIEIVEEAVEAAKKNAALNNLDNCYFLAGDVLKAIDEFTEKPDLIILDPPREGIHPKAIKKIINYGAKELVYVSCKPTSLVRDLEVLVESGYEIERVKCVDMFPFTPHVETCVSLKKIK